MRWWVIIRQSLFQNKTLRDLDLYFWETGKALLCSKDSLKDNLLIITHTNSSQGTTKIWGRMFPKNKIHSISVHLRVNLIMLRISLELHQLQLSKLKRKGIYKLAVVNSMVSQHTIKITLVYLRNIKRSMFLLATWMLEKVSLTEIQHMLKIIMELEEPLHKRLDLKIS